MFLNIIEDILVGFFFNMIVGRICNFFDFDGGGYMVDGVCFFLLIVIVIVCNYLKNGELDLVLVGGVDVSLDIFELIGFVKIRVLIRGDMNVYDCWVSGFIFGEGCGFVVFKWLEDVCWDGDYVYFVINGWGIFFDGKGVIIVFLEYG